MIPTASVHPATAETTTTAEQRNLPTVFARPTAWTTTASDAQASDHQSGDSVPLSAEGLARSRQQPRSNAVADHSATNRGGQAGTRRLTPAEEQELRELQQRDRDVKAHEQTHLAVAGRHARGGASYTYQQGPDGQRYATGGEVPIDASAEPSPGATVEKIRTVRRAALAPAQPSPADRAIAAAAAAAKAQALVELRAAQSELRSSDPPAVARNGPSAESDPTENSHRRTPLAVVA